ncbi:hypothetical protein AB6N24_14380 [Cellulomonas sp. 179-A 4D5 NHS]
MGSEMCIRVSTGLDVGAVAGAAMVLMIAGAAALVVSHRRRLRAQR